MTCARLRRIIDTCRWNSLLQVDTSDSCPAETLSARGTTSSCVSVIFLQSTFDSVFGSTSVRPEMKPMPRLTSRAAMLTAGVLVACTTVVTNGPPRTTLPPDVSGARARLAASPRHGEWVMISAGSDSVRAWIVYPERKTKAPVVVVVHEIYGL